MYKSCLVRYVLLGFLFCSAINTDAEGTDCELLAVAEPLISVSLPRDAVYYSEAGLISKDAAVRSFLRGIGMVRGSIGKIENVHDSFGNQRGVKTVSVFDREYSDGFTFNSEDEPFVFRVHTLKNPAPDGSYYRVTLGLY